MPGAFSVPVDIRILRKSKMDVFRPKTISAWCPKFLQNTNAHSAVLLKIRVAMVGGGARGRWKFEKRTTFEKQANRNVNQAANKFENFFVRELLDAIITLFRSRTPLNVV